MENIAFDCHKRYSFYSIEDAADERWTSRGRCKVVVENFGEWTPIELPSE